MTLSNPPELFLNDAQVAARYGVNRATPWRWAKSRPDFPKPICLSPGCTRWKLSEIEAWEATQTAAA
jgi:prophage regulatory protein